MEYKAFQWSDIIVDADENLETKSDGNLKILVDADIIAYQSAATCDGRSYLIDGKNFKYKKDAVSYCEEKSLDLKDIDLKYFPDPESYALRNVKMSLEKLKMRYPGAAIEYFVSGSKNFREEIVSDYKVHRADKMTPTHLNACKQYLLNRHKAKMKEGLEADDLIGIRAMQLRDVKIDYIVATLDKDLNMIPGKHYNWRKEIEFEVTEDEALINFYIQLLTGDKTDNIYGLKGIAAPTATKLLSGVPRTHEDLYRACRDIWIAKEFPGAGTDEVKEMNPVEVSKRKQEVEDRMITSGKLLWIRRDASVHWEPPIRRIHEEEACKAVESNEAPVLPVSVDAGEASVGTSGGV